MEYFIIYPWHRNHVNANKVNPSRRTRVNFSDDTIINQLQHIGQSIQEWTE